MLFHVLCLLSNPALSFGEGDEVDPSFLHMENHQIIIQLHRILPHIIQHQTSLLGSIEQELRSTSTGFYDQFLLLTVHSFPSKHEVNSGTLECYGNETLQGQELSVKPLPEARRSHCLGKGKGHGLLQ